MRRADHEYFDGIRDTHRGERAYVIATGPSLGQLDLSLLKHEFTVGVNHLVKWDALPFTPSAWAASEYDGRERVAEGIAHLTMPKWWANENWPAMDTSWKWLYKDPKVMLNSPNEWKWKGDPDAMGLGDEFWRTATAYSPVQEAAIPVLNWMGFQEIYLLGVDHTIDKGHVYSSDIPNVPIEMRKQRIGASDKAYVHMLEMMEERGRKLRNCSPNSLAPVPYVPLRAAVGVMV